MVKSMFTNACLQKRRFTAVCKLRGVKRTVSTCCQEGNSSVFVVSRLNINVESGINN